MVTPEQTHQRVRRLLWSLLAFATTASVSGNITRAVAMHAGVSAVGPIVAAALAPVALLGLTHLLGLWSHIAARGLTYWSFLAAIVVLAAAAFRLSFDALRALAITYGYARFDAALFPLILDGLVAVCTLGLVALTRIEVAAETRQVTQAVETQTVTQAKRPAAQVTQPAPPVTQPVTQMTRTVTQPDAARSPQHHRDAAVTQPEAAADADDARAGTRDVGAAQSVTHPDAAGASLHRGPDAAMHLTQPVTQRPLHRDAPARQPERPAAAATHGDGSESAAADVGARPHRADNDPPPRIPRLVEVGASEHVTLAHRLIDSGRTTAPAETVRAVLEHTASGASSRAVAEALGVSPSSVQRIVKAAREVSSSGAA